VYSWIWRHLPGPTAVRVLTAAGLVLVVVGVLFQWGFEHLAPYVPFNDGTVTE
jgi:hypothetical protein